VEALALVGRLVAARAWDRLGYVRLRNYAVERLGLSARQVQDLDRAKGSSARQAGVLGRPPMGRGKSDATRVPCSRAPWSAATASRARSFTGV
jgi:hypothetical protein